METTKELEPKNEEQKKDTMARTPVTVASHPIGGLIPHDLDQLWRLATMMARSGMMPKGIQTPEAIAVAITMGLEVGLSPMSAVQNIAVINGRPSIWGDSVLGLVRASGLLEDFDEYFEGDGDELQAVCKAKRKDQKTEILRTFSVADAKLANLWEKKSKEGYPSPWILYPKRMLQMRARSWTLRDGFGDVIKGLRVAEEVIDMVTSNGKSFDIGGDPIADLNEKIKQPASTDEQKADIYEAQEVKPDSEEKADPKPEKKKRTKKAPPVEESPSDPSPKADEETDQQRMLRFADGAELVDFAGEKMVIVKCPIKDDKPTEKWCSRCNDRQGCDSWKKYDAQVG